MTGGARGMGYETARHLTSLGMHVVIGKACAPFCDPDLPALNRLREPLSVNKPRLHAEINVPSSPLNYSCAVSFSPAINHCNALLPPSFLSALRLPVTAF